MTPEVESLFTWTALAALGGATLFTFLCVQYTKAYVDRLARGRIATDIYAWFIGTFTLLAASWALKALTLENAVLCVFNGILIAAAAGQMYNKVVNPPGQAVRDTEAGE